MLIEGMIKSSLIDYPKLVSCVIFTAGCNFDCFYCHNRELIKGTGNTINQEDVFDFLKKRQGLLDGLVITGGEPTLHKDLIPFTEKVKTLGYKVKLDTNGSNPQVVKDLINKKLVDYFAVDYKAPYNKYQDIRAYHPDKVLETINLIASSDIDYEVRTTVYPTLSLDDLKTMAKELPPLKNFVLNRYRIPDSYLEKDKDLINAKAHSIEEIKDFAKELTNIQKNTRA